MIRNPLKVGDVKEKDADTIVADIVTQAGQCLVQKLGASIATMALCNRSKDKVTDMTALGNDGSVGLRIWPDPHCCLGSSSSIVILVGAIHIGCGFARWPRRAHITYPPPSRARPCWRSLRPRRNQRDPNICKRRKIFSVTIRRGRGTLTEPCAVVLRGEVELRPDRHDAGRIHVAAGCRNSAA